MSSTKEAYFAAKAARAVAALSLAERAAYGIGVPRDSALATAYRDADAKCSEALKAWHDDHQSRVAELLVAAH